MPTEMEHLILRTFLFFFVEKVEINQRLPLIIPQEPICYHFKGFLGSGFFPNRQLALGVKIKTHLKI
jgi:hypothetical protein